MKVLLIQTGEPIHSEIKKFKGMRLINFSNYLNSENVNVQIITSLFNHQTKQFREFKQKDLAILSKFKYIFLN